MTWRMLFTEVIEYNAWVLPVILALFVCVVYSCIRSRRSIKVNCWFCNENSIIKRSASLWWFCAYCEQYNGFNKHGDYNEEIPEMYDENIYSPKFCASNGSQQSDLPKNLMCQSCQNKQHYKMKEIASFTPTDDVYFEEEYADHKLNMDKKYKVCLSCQTTISYHLRQQDQQIRRTHFYENINKDQTARKLKTNIFPTNTHKRWLFIGHVVSLVAAFWLSKQQSIHHTSNITLTGTTMLLFIWNVAVIYLTRKFQKIASLSSLLWLVLSLYGNYATKDSRHVRAYVLSSIIGMEIMMVLHAILSLIFNTWKHIKYLNHRKRKIEQARNSPKSTRGMTELKKNNKINKNILHSEDKSPSVLLKEPKMKLDSAAPDLLHGHLDAMYIERVSQNTATDKEGKDANHVIAALKYTSDPPSFHPSLLKANQPKPLIRPAKLIWSSKSNSIEENNNNNSSALKQRNKIQQEKDCTQDAEIERNKVPLEQGSSTIENQQRWRDIKTVENKQEWRIWNHLSWTYVFLFIIFTLSISCNLYFVAWK